MVQAVHCQGLSGQGCELNSPASRALLQLTEGDREGYLYKRVYIYTHKESF